MREIEALLFIGFITFFILTVLWYVKRDEKGTAKPTPPTTPEVTPHE